MHEQGFGGGRPKPERPVLSAREHWYREAFVQLSNSRGVAAQGFQPITFSDMKAYVEMFGCVGSVDQFVFVMQRLDQQWLKNQS